MTADFLDVDFAALALRLRADPDAASSIMSNGYNIVLAALDRASRDDGSAWMRLLELGPGHVMTEQDAADIRALIDGYNDEIGKVDTAYERAREAVLREIGGDALVAAAGTADEWQSKVAVDKAMRHFQMKAAQYEAEANTAATAA